jgi:hypothetical protein
MAGQARPVDYLRSLEEVILTLAYGDRKPIRAYRRYLESNVPKSCSTSPGSAEVALRATSYWKDHLAGDRLPYFAPYDISELNIFANMTGKDFVVYRQTGRRTAKIRPLTVVADTRLFSMNHNRPGAQCIHITISSKGAKKLSAFGLSRVRVSQMLPNVSARAAVVFERPLDLTRRLKDEITDDDVAELEKMSFLDLRSETSLLDKFGKIVGRPIRLFAANCTSRFKRKAGDGAPDRVRVRMVEQRSTPMDVSGQGEPPVVICLQARTTTDGKMTADAVWNLETACCGPGKVGKEKLRTAVETTEVLASAMRGAESNVPEQAKAEEPRKMTSQIRRDPCCSDDPEFACEACAQLTEEFRETKRPPIQSTHFMYNPQKSPGGSFLAEARSLGLCEIFPWLEDAVFRSNLMSCSAMDIETLNVPVGVGATSGTSSSLTSPGEISGGCTVLTRHVPFAIGTTSFMAKHVARRAVDGLIWRLQREAGKYVEFRVTETSDVPGQSDVGDMVHRWLGYIENRRRVISFVKRKRFRPLRIMLERMEARSDAFLKETGSNADGRIPCFGFSVYGRLLKQLGRMCEVINVVTYNGAKFVLINILTHILSSATRRNMQVSISKKGEFRTISDPDRRSQKPDDSLQEQRFVS